MKIFDNHTLQAAATTPKKWSERERYKEGAKILLREGFISHTDTSHQFFLTREEPRQSVSSRENCAISTYATAQA
jgi:hypothetical protein